MKKYGSDVLHGKSLSLGSLHHEHHGDGCRRHATTIITFFKSLVYVCINFVGAHRALPDVIAMEQVLTHPSLVRCLCRLPIQTPAKQLNLWMQQKRAHNRTAALVKALGKPSLTPAQAKRLDSLGLDMKELLRLRNSQQC